MKAVILGAGPSGLAATHELANYGAACTVLDRHDRPGGLCRTLEFDGFLFDIGGHRFLSRSVEVNALWKEVLGPDLLIRSRKSRIYFRGKLYDYPLRLWSALRKLGFMEAFRCMASYAAAQGHRPETGASFEAWMIRRFGRRLYENFFKSYTEKVWGIPCSRLSSDWASQRIQKLSLRKAIQGALFSEGNASLKTLSGKFYYPRLGPGQFCDRLRERCEERAASFYMGREIHEIQTRDDRVDSVTFGQNGSGRQSLEGDFFLSSIPVSVLVERMRPSVPPSVLQAARSLRFRSFISVNLIYRAESLFEDHWVYLHSPEVRAGRVQNYKNWSREMVPDEKMTSLGVEYFVEEGDDLWLKSDEALVQLAVSELELLGLASARDFEKGFAVRVPKAYPVYGPGYSEAVAHIRQYLDRFSNLQTMGRAGLFRYNNSDHALLTGLFAARNVMGEKHDLWSVDPDLQLADDEA